MAVRKQPHKIAGVLQYAAKPRRAHPVEQDMPHAEYAAEETEEVIIAKAVEWYRIGAKRGAQEVLQAILKGDLALRRDRHGNLEVTASKKSFEWTQALTVNTVANRIRTEEYKHKLRIEDLGFKQGS